MPLTTRPWIVAVLLGLLAILPASGSAEITTEDVKASEGYEAKADQVEKPAHAAYPRPFSRPGSMGADYDTWRDAKGPDIGETAVDISACHRASITPPARSSLLFTNRKVEPVVSSRRSPQSSPTK